MSLGLDDGGSRSTGKYLSGLTVSYDHALTLNDLFYLTLQRDVGGREAGPRGTSGTVAHYSLPLGYWLLGFNASLGNPARDRHLGLGGMQRNRFNAGVVARSD